eukprot:GHVL01022855.1.p1 GENE.GHVL01022855.1~~GHVL01022855.1.p1  ORF type:complete len:1423 (-),score=243.30 GHVL01022855.1:1545-5813(-)
MRRTFSENTENVPPLRKPTPRKTTGGLNWETTSDDSNPSVRNASIPDTTKSLRRRVTFTDAHTIEFSPGDSLKNQGKSPMVERIRSPSWDTPESPSRRIGTPYSATNTTPSSSIRSSSVDSPDASSVGRRSSIASSVGEFEEFFPGIADLAPADFGNTSGMPKRPSLAGFTDAWMPTMKSLNSEVHTGLQFDPKSPAPATPSSSGPIVRESSTVVKRTSSILKSSDRKLSTTPQQSQRVSTTPTPKQTTPRSSLYPDIIPPNILDSSNYVEKEEPRKLGAATPHSDLANEIISNAVHRSSLNNMDESDTSIRRRMSCVSGLSGGPKSAATNKSFSMDDCCSEYSQGTALNFGNREDSAEITNATGSIGPEATTDPNALREVLMCYPGGRRVSMMSRRGSTKGEAFSDDDISPDSQDDATFGDPTDDLLQTFLAEGRTTESLSSADGRQNDAPWMDPKALRVHLETSESNKTNETSPRKSNLDEPQSAVSKGPSTAVKPKQDEFFSPNTTEHPEMSTYGITQEMTGLHKLAQGFGVTSTNKYNREDSTFMQMSPTSAAKSHRFSLATPAEMQKEKPNKKGRKTLGDITTKLLTRPSSGAPPTEDKYSPEQEKMISASLALAVSPPSRDDESATPNTANKKSQSPRKQALLLSDGSNVSARLTTSTKRRKTDGRAYVASSTTSNAKELAHNRRPFGSVAPSSVDSGTSWPNNDYSNSGHSLPKQESKNEQQRKPFGEVDATKRVSNKSSRDGSLIHEPTIDPENMPPSISPFAAKSSSTSSNSSDHPRFVSSDDSDHEEDDWVEGPDPPGFQNSHVSITPKNDFATRRGSQGSNHLPNKGVDSRRKTVAVVRSDEDSNASPEFGSRLPYNHLDEADNHQMEVIHEISFDNIVLRPLSLADVYDLCKAAGIRLTTENYSNGAKIFSSHDCLDISLPQKISTYLCRRAEVECTETIVKLLYEKTLEAQRDFNIAKKNMIVSQQNCDDTLLYKLSQSLRQACAESSSFKEYAGRIIEIGADDLLRLAPEIIYSAQVMPVLQNIGELKTYSWRVVRTLYKSYTKDAIENLNANLNSISERAQEDIDVVKNYVVSIEQQVESIKLDTQASQMDSEAEAARSRAMKTTNRAIGLLEDEANARRRIIARLEEELNETLIKRDKTRKEVDELKEERDASRERFSSMNDKLKNIFSSLCLVNVAGKLVGGGFWNNIDVTSEDDCVNVSLLASKYAWPQDKNFSFLHPRVVLSLHQSDDNSRDCRSCRLSLEPSRLECLPSACVQFLSIIVKWFNSWFQDYRQSRYVKGQQSLLWVNNFLLWLGKFLLFVNFFRPHKKIRIISTEVKSPGVIELSFQYALKHEIIETQLSLGSLQGLPLGKKQSNWSITSVVPIFGEGEENEKKLEKFQNYLEVSINKDDESNMLWNIVISAES